MEMDFFEEINQEFIKKLAIILRVQIERKEKHLKFQRIQWSPIFTDFFGRHKRMASSAFKKKSVGTNV